MKNPYILPFAIFNIQNKSNLILTITEKALK